MIRKFVHLDAPPDLVRQMWHDLESWPEWMPGFRAVRIVERRENVVVINTKQVQVGTKMAQLMECRLDPDGMLQRQIKGMPKRWRADWRFFRAPEGRGTTVRLELDFDLGLLGLMVPKRTVDRAIHRFYLATARAAQHRSQRLAAARSAEDGQVLLAVFLHQNHLEVQLGGRRFRVEAME